MRKLRYGQSLAQAYRATNNSSHSQPLRNECYELTKQSGGEDSHEKYQNEVAEKMYYFKQ